MSEVSDKPPRLSVAEFTRSFHDDDMHYLRVKQYAYDVQDNLAKFFNALDLRLDPKELSQSDFAAVIDPALPTIVVDSEGCYGGSELLGLAVHDRDKKMNIIYVSTVTKSLEIKTNQRTNKSHMEVSSGVVVLPSGQVAYGEFPFNLLVDGLETGDESLLEQCEEIGIKTFQDRSEIDYYDDKSKLESLIKNEITKTPRRLAKTAFMALNNTDYMVIKPTHRQSGIGVRLTDEGANPNRTKRFYTFLDEHGYEPLVEERVRTYAIKDPETGERLDWNVRAIISYGELVDMYVRADNWGGPVNMCISARAIRMNDFPNFFPDKNIANEVTKKLVSAANAVAQENPYSFAGIDLTVDEGMHAYIFEIGSYVRGVQTMAELENTYESKLAPTNKLLDGYYAHTKKNIEIINESELKTSFVTSAFNKLVWMVSDTPQYNKLSLLDKDAMPTARHEWFGVYAALFLLMIRAYETKDYDAQHQINALIQQQYPLEVQDFFRNAYAYSLNKSDWKQYIEEYFEVFDADDEDMQFYRLSIAAYEGDIACCALFFKKLVKQGCKPGRISQWITQGFEVYFADNDERCFDLIRDFTTAFFAYGDGEARRLLARKLERADEALSAVIAKIISALGDTPIELL